MHYISNRIERVFDPLSMKVTMYHHKSNVYDVIGLSVGEATLHMKIKKRSVKNDGV